MLNCFKKKKPKHACCCCCRANCTNRPIFNPNTEEELKNEKPQTNSISTAEDGNIFSKTSGTCPISTAEDSDSDKGPSCYAFGSRSLNSDPLIESVERDEDKGRMPPPIHTVMYMPVSKDDPFYNMQHPRRGKAVIFNFDHWNNTAIRDLTWTGDFSPRIGSQKDKKDLAQSLKRLDFDVATHDNCDNTELWTILTQLRAEDHTDADCLIVSIMTHGERNLIFVRDGTQIPVNLIWEFFEADKCPTLAGKPKIFIIQACRGKSYDSGTILTHSRQEREIQENMIREDVTDSATFSYVIPNSADFLIAFSCPLGHYSWRNPELGSWFIQSICKIFDKYGHKMQLQSLFVEVARDVALNYQSSTTEYHSDKKKQVTSTSSTLIRKVIFKPKKLNLESPQHFQTNGILKTTAIVQSIDIETQVIVEPKDIEIQVESNV